jgi:hypothetical protein
MQYTAFDRIMVDAIRTSTRWGGLHGFWLLGVGLGFRMQFRLGSARLKSLSLQALVLIGRL